MNIAIIMAGGSGSRMAKNEAQAGVAPQTAQADVAPHATAKALPKQFMMLGGKPLILYSLDKFLESGCFDAVYIGMHPDWVEYMGDLISCAKEDSSDTASTSGSDLTPYRDYLPPLGLHIVTGGADRNATLLNVLDAIESDLRDEAAQNSTNKAEVTNCAMSSGRFTDPIIVTHDAARPFVTVEMIKESIEAAQSVGAATVAIPTTDTIAVSSCVPAGSPDVSYPTVTEIPNRKTLYNIQTPQSFKLSYFREAYYTLSKDQISSLTDVCGVFVAAKKTVAIVSGGPSNIKITTDFDLKVAESVL